MTENKLYVYKMKLDRVVDGDTLYAFIDVGFKMTMKANVRLLGIDTPESRTRDLQEKAHALASKNALGDMLINAKDIIIECKEVDKYGRVLGLIYADGISVNYDLIDRGYACPYSGGTKISYKDKLQRYPAMAKVREQIGTK
jgi:endonuclease YncB( thermonuclease family)